MLWVALELPALPLQMVERAGVSPAPLVISEGLAQRPVVACANQAARDAGIRLGQAVAAAKALAGELRVVPRNEGAEIEALQRIAAWAGQFTPMVALDAQGIVLEVASSLRLFQGHARLTAAIARGIRELGFHANFGVAPTALAARLFARAEAHGMQVRGCLAPEALEARIADLPLFLLDWPERTLAHLTDLGIVRFRDLLQLPAQGLAQRFGPETVIALDRLMGRAADPRTPYVPPARFRSRLELPAEADGVEALLFPLRRLLHEMEGVLRGRGAGVQRAQLKLEHGRRSFTRLGLEFASAEREADFILAIAREKLGRLQLAAPTHAIELRAETLQPYVPRSAAWLPGPRESAIERERLLERLAARLGRERVLRIAIANDHRPEKAVRGEAASAGSGRDQKPGSLEGRAPSRPIWLLRRPQRLVAEAGAPRLQGALDFLAGPERIEAGWWDGEEVRRDYFVAANPHGETYWIYREHRNPHAWYLHGIFS